MAASGGSPDEAEKDPNTNSKSSRKGQHEQDKRLEAPRKIAKSDLFVLVDKTFESKLH